jgi:hypothetical protein
MNNLLKTFPQLSLHPEKSIKHSVSPNRHGIFMAIPKGDKFFVWFVMYKGTPCCFIINKRTRHYQQLICSFDKTLSLGTILYGTKFNYKNKTFFTFEDIYYFKGKKLYNNFKENKIYINKVFQAVKNDSNMMIFGFPVYNSNYKELIHNIKNIYYPIYSIQFRDNSVNNQYLTKLYEKVKDEKKAIFCVKPDSIVDIYKLYCKDNDFYGLAHIPNIKVSILMNQLFRRIKENINIDLVEESDNDEEFETNNTNYIVNNQLNIECVYSDKFNAWIPINKTDKIVSKTKKMVRKIELS